MRKALALVVVALAFPASAASFNPQPDPPGFERLLASIRAVDDPNTRGLEATVFAAGNALERGQACTSLNILGALDNQLAAIGVDDPNIRPVIAALDAKIAEISSVIDGGCPSD